MVLPFLDSFDHYDSAHSSQKWGSPITIVAAVGRDGTQAAQIAGSGITLPLGPPSAYGTLYIGAAFLNPGAATFEVSSSVSLASVTMRLLTDGRFIMQGNDPTGGFFTAFTGSQVSKPILLDRWYYLEMYAEIQPSSITVAFYINEEQVLSETHVLAGTITAGAAWDTLTIAGRGAGLSTLVDDFYVSADGLFGDVRIRLLQPNGPDTTMWIPVPATANWNNVKETFSDDTATNVTSQFVGDLDTYSMSDVLPGAKIPAIQGLISAKKDNAGAAGIKLQFGSGTGAILSDEFILGLSYAYFRNSISSIGPTPLTGSLVNGLVFGQVRTT